LLDAGAPKHTTPHRLHREFYYGISLGERRAAIVRGRFYTESAPIVALRRVLQWAYYRRFRRLAQRLGRHHAHRTSEAS
jgi:hypothetical protein